MEKNSRFDFGKWKVVLGSEWDGTVFIFDTAKDAADFAQQAANSQNSIFQEYGSRKIPSITIEFLNSQKCYDIVAEYEEEQRKKEQEENA